MKSLVEAVTIIVLFILTPVIVVWVLIGLAQVIENSSVSQTAAQRGHSELA